MLFVIDGSKALVAAIRGNQGKRALIQRAGSTSVGTSAITCQRR